MLNDEFNYIHYSNNQDNWYYPTDFVHWSSWKRTETRNKDYNRLKMLVTIVTALVGYHCIRLWLLLVTVTKVMNVFLYYIDQSLSASASEFHFNVQSHEYCNMIGEQASIIGTFLVCINDCEVLLTKLPVQLKLPSLTVTINNEGN